MRRKILWVTFWTIMAYWLGNAWGCAAGGADQNYKVLGNDQPRFETTTPTHSGPTIDGSMAAQPMAERRVVRLPARAATPAPAAAAPVQPAAAPSLALAGGSAPATGAAALPASDTAPSLSGIDRSRWPKVTVTMPAGTVHHKPVYFYDYAPDDVAGAMCRDEEAFEYVAEGAGAGLRHAIGWEPWQGANAPPAEMPAATAKAPAPAPGGAASAGAAGSVAATSGAALDITAPLPDDHDALMRQVMANPTAKGWLTLNSEDLSIQDVGVNNALGAVVQPVKYGLDMLALPFKAVVTPPWTDVTTP